MHSSICVLFTFCIMCSSTVQDEVHVFVPSCHLILCARVLWFCGRVLIHLPELVAAGLPDALLTVESLAVCVTFGTTCHGPFHACVSPATTLCLWGCELCA